MLFDFKFDTYESEINNHKFERLASLVEIITK